MSSVATNGEGEHELIPPFFIFIPGGYTWTPSDESRSCTAVQQLHGSASICYHIRRGVWCVESDWTWKIGVSLAFRHTHSKWWLNSFFCDLKVNYFLIILKERHHFFLIIWQQFVRTYYCPRDMTFPQQPYFDRHVFQNSNFSYFIIKNIFLVVFLKVFCSFYGVFTRLNYFWAYFGGLFEVLEKSRSPTWWTKMATIQIIMTQILRHLTH